MIAGHIDDARALARLAQQLLHDVIVRLRPIPAALQPPAVDDVADEIKGVGVMMLQKVEQQLGLKPSGAEMEIRQEQRPEALGALRIGQ